MNVTSTAAPTFTYEKKTPHYSCAMRENTPVRGGDDTSNSHTSASSSTKPRIRSIDIAKAIAMFAIISGHFGIVSINNVVYGFHVPLFFIVSGYFFSTKHAFSSSIVQKLRQLMIPYMIVGLVYIPVLTAVLLLQHSDKQTIVANISKIPLALLYGAGVPVHSPAVLPQIGLLWFLPALCFAFLLVRIALEARHTVLLIVLYFMIGWISMLFFHAPLSIQPALMGTFFIYIGYKALSLIHISEPTRRPG